ncbi:MAG: flagellar basal body rod protein FlgB [Planctomycetes bacterium]|nr:flagellar basal body rod protein FlgB [Planctomycetota bacterium]
MSDLTRGFDVAAKLLDFTSARARALATNIAHASQPGWRRVDVEFGALLEAVRLERDGGRKGALARVEPEARIDESALPGSNGNSVDFEREQVQSDKNALLHQLATEFINSKLNGLRSAIRGQA